MQSIVSQQKINTLWWISLVAFFLLSSISAQANTILPELITPETGKEYYTRYNFYYERNKHNTTNYARGILVPVNTKVTLTSISAKKIKLEINGQPITFVNAKKFTRRDTDVIASELLSSTEIPLSKANPKFLADLKTGILRLGMTKEEVLITRGYPPRHKTPSNESNRWVYWINKFVKLTLVFDNDKLTQGRGVF